MISGRLVHLIETHGDRIIDRVISQIRREPEMVHIRSLLDSELREYGQELLKNLGRWLTASNDDELARRYDRLGRIRFEEDVPLHESVRALCLIREKMQDFVAEQMASKDVMELYAEEELDRRLERFFDLLIIHLVRGYERAWRHATAPATARG
jgi:hypothetical protein